MGYDTYCFQTLPTDINQPLARGSYNGTDLNGNPQ